MSIATASIKDRFIKIFTSFDEIFDFVQNSFDGVCLQAIRSSDACYINPVLQSRLQLELDNIDPFSLVSNTYKNRLQELRNRSQSAISQTKLQFTLKSGLPLLMKVKVMRVVDPETLEPFLLFGFNIKSSTYQVKKKEWQYVQSLLKSERRFKSLVENATDGILIINTSEQVLFVSEALQRILGYSAQEIKSHSIIELCHPEYRHVVRDQFAESLANPGLGIQKKASKWQHKDGSWRWIEGYFTNMLNDTAINGVIINFRDITKLIDARNTLVKRTKLKRLLMNISTRYINIPLEKVETTISESLKDIGKFVEADRVYIFDYDFKSGTCTNTHEWCDDGISAEIASNKNLPLDMFNQQWIINHIAGKSNAIHDVSRLENVEFREFLQSQNIKSLLTIPLMQGENCVGFVGFDSVKSIRRYNITEVNLLNVFAEMLVNFRMRMENTCKLKRLLNKVENQNSTLMDFSFITSHNLRSSVANIMGIVDLIDYENGTNEFVELLRSSTDRLNNTLKNINQLIHFENEGLVEPTPVNLKNLLSQVIENNKLLAASQHAKFNISIPENIEVKTIPAYLESILHNIINNALKYGVNAQQTDIDINIEKLGCEIIMEITDHGSGIDLKEYGTKLFDLGSRFSTKSEGEGLGLFMSKRQIEVLEGKLELKSKPEKGTSVKITLHA